MMTGQILAGTNPSDAIRYQIVIIFAQAAGKAIATIGVIILAFLALFIEPHTTKSRVIPASMISA